MDWLNQLDEACEKAFSGRKPRRAHHRRMSERAAAEEGEFVGQRTTSSPTTTTPHSEFQSSQISPSSSPQPRRNAVYPGSTKIVKKRRQHPRERSHSASLAFHDSFQEERIKPRSTSPVPGSLIRKSPKRRKSGGRTSQLESPAAGSLKRPPVCNVDAGTSASATPSTRQRLGNEETLSSSSVSSSGGDEVVRGPGPGSRLRTPSAAPRSSGSLKAAGTPVSERELPVSASSSQQRITSPPNRHDLESSSAHTSFWGSILGETPARGSPESHPLSSEAVERAAQVRPQESRTSQSEGVGSRGREPPLDVTVVETEITASLERVQQEIDATSSSSREEPPMQPPGEGSQQESHRVPAFVRQREESPEREEAPQAVASSAREGTRPAPLSAETFATAGLPPDRDEDSFFSTETQYSAAEEGGGEGLVTGTLEKEGDLEEVDLGSSGSSVDLVAALLSAEEHRTRAETKTSRPSPSFTIDTALQEPAVSEVFATPAGHLDVSVHSLESRTSVGSEIVTENATGTQSSSPEPSLSRESLPQHVECLTGYDEGPFLPTWIEEEGKQFFEKRMNCFGVVHVRIIRAQCLPCPVGSSVQAILSLPPWKGKVRVQNVKSFSGPTERSGVCAEWDELNIPSVAMVHAYSDEESPVPSIQIELLFRAVGLFDFSMCTLKVSCKALMMNPLVAKRQWFVTSESDINDRQLPIIEIEAMFEPAGSDNPAEVPVRRAEEMDRVGKTPAEAGELGSRESVDGSVLGEASVPPSPRGFDDRSQFDTSLSLKGEVVAPTKQHLLRRKAHWIPATCCVCGRNIMSGLTSRQSFHCEVCNVDCCDDCRLQVDIQLPCSSSIAAEAVSKAVQSKLTVQNILNVVAPVDETHAKKMEQAIAVAAPGHKRKSALSTMASIHEHSDGCERGVGVVKLDFVRAHILRDHMPMETDAENIVSMNDTALCTGDYYVRVKWTGSEKTSRTRTIQNTGRPTFESREMRFIVPHYGTEFRIEVVDAATDKPIGATLITAQTLLQQQRDFIIEEQGAPFLSLLRRPLTFKGKLKLLLELRTGLKSGFGTDFFAKGSLEGDSRTGDVAGCIEVLAGLEEDLDSLYGKRPYECPGRPGDELNMSIFQSHIGRIMALIEDVKGFFAMYVYIISWENPFVTALSLYLFVRLSLSFDPAYIGSVPVFLLIVFMLYLAVRRSFGKFKQKFIRKEIEANRKAEKVTLGYSIHRPAGLVRARCVRGRHLRSPELGLPGNCRCSVHWDPTRHMTEKKKKEAIATDKASSSMHDIGSTNFVYSANPEWEQMIESDVSKRLKQLMPSQGEFFIHTDQTHEVDFPVLQPFRVSHDDLQYLVPWKSSVAAVVVSVRLTDVLSVLPGSEYSVGEVSIAFSDLVEKGKIEGWFRLQGVGELPERPVSVQGDADEQIESDGTPQIFLELQWIPPEEGTDRSIEMQREASIVIEEELIRSAHLRSQQQINIVGSSINTVRGISGYLLILQNTLGSALDLFESFIHAFDFSDPFKSFVILGVLVLLFLALSIVPLRAFVLCIGTAQYAVTFKARLDRWLRSQKKLPPRAESDAFSLEDSEGSPIGTWILNALRSLPTSEDLRRTYFWESRRVGAREREALASEKRRSRLRRLWRVEWSSAVQILTLNEKTGKSNWRKVFAMMQGHRFIWWRSVGDFDGGVPPLGSLLLAGHSGLATPSPLELRVISPEELPRTVCIFGRGEEDQDRITILVPTVEEKEDLERSIIRGASSKVD